MTFGVAAFDLDGTLIDAHSMPRFAAAVARPPALVGAVPRVAASVFPRPSTLRFKQAFWRHVLAGRPIDEVRDRGRGFARDLVEHHLDAAMVETVERHRRAGDQLVLVTAALDVYAEPVGEHLAFDAVLSTRVEVEGGRCTGELADPDMKDRTKVDRLREWLGRREAEATVYAYGNSGDDAELLAYAKARRRDSVR